MQLGFVTKKNGWNIQDFHPIYWFDIVVAKQNTNSGMGSISKAGEEEIKKKEPGILDMWLGHINSRLMIEGKYFTMDGSGGISLVVVRNWDLSPDVLFSKLNWWLRSMPTFIFTKE